MYILINIGTNDIRTNELASKDKSKLEQHIKEKGFYFSKKNGRYIDDRTSGIAGGSGSEYFIEKIEEI